MARFVVARNPDEQSKLPFLLRVPIDDGIVLKARDRWPTTTRVYCHEAETQRRALRAGDYAVVDWTYRYLGAARAELG